MKTGALVISLDFELVWGIFDHIEITDKVSYFNNTLHAIPQMLELFEKYNINATWATVGMLFNENWEEWDSNVPEQIPTYERTILNAYTYGELHKKSGFDQFFFAPHLIKDIQNVKGQELGTHTYSHYYCLEKGQTIDQFEADIKLAVKMANQFGVQLQSLVFPRNQFNKNYLRVCTANQLTTVRSNPGDWYWDTTKPDTIFSKLARTGDAYIPIGKKSYLPDSVVKDVIISQPASRFLRPQHKLIILNKVRLQRIKNEIIQAAKNGEIYHLWWHPHNFGIDTENAIQSLREIIEVYIYCHQTYGMKSLTMQQLCEIV